jgi:DNA-binding protein H-NS
MKMARNDLARMPLRSLMDLEARVGRAKVQARERARAELKEKIEGLLREAGVSMAELFGRGGRRSGKVAPKYRNPDNPAETWTGRGRQPRWLAAKIKAGSKLERFLIGRRSAVAANAVVG